MADKKLNISGFFLRECIRKFNYIQRNHLTYKYTQIEHLQNVADNYFAHYCRDELIIKDDDTQTFAEYINTFGLDQKEELLNKLQAQVSYDVREYLTTPQTQTWWTKLWNTKKEKNTSEKQSFWQRTKNKIKYLIPTALVVIGGAFGLKNDSNAKISAQPDTTNTPSKLPDFKQYGMPKPIDYSFDTFLKTASVTSPKTFEPEAKPMTNFYKYRLAKFLGAKKSQKMLDNMARQIKSGKITLPADISAAHYLYTAEIYRRYGYLGIAKNLNNVQKSKNAITQEVQDSLFKYVRLAGKKGTGVQQMRHGQQIKRQSIRN